jgi:type VI protein secretion system component Hcp
VSSTRKALQSAVFEHLRQKGKITGYMIVTFRDCIATFISDAGGGDEAL